MAENTAIEWCDHTFNPWIGCTKVSPACDHCYAARQDAFRKWTPEGWGGPRRRTSDALWRKPKQWNDAHAEFYAAHGRRQRVFCASLADVFDNEVEPAWRDELLGLIATTPNLDWLLLTKRIGNVSQMVKAEAWQHLPHVWLGATVVNQVEADRDIPKLLQVPARVRFLSIEPMLGPINLQRHLWECCGNYQPGNDHGLLGQEPDQCCGNPEPRGALDWVIAGGESGPGARPMHPEWLRSLRDQCAAAGVPYLFKQWGEWLPGHQYTPELQAFDSDLSQSRFESIEIDEDDGLVWGRNLHPSEQADHHLWRVGKARAGRLLDGVEHNGFPT